MSNSGMKIVGLAALVLGLAGASIHTPAKAADHTPDQIPGQTAGSDENRLWWDTDQNPLLGIFNGPEAIDRPRIRSASAACISD